MIKAYKIRCFPTEEQKSLIVKTFGCCRWYWNQALADNIKYYEENKKSKINTPAFYKKEYGWLKEVDGQALCFTQMDLQSAFSGFFKQPNKGFPKFKSKKCPKNSYIPCHWTGNCDAYSPVYPLNIIESENKMIDFVEKAEHFFNCPEAYESYFGFERKWDEETGDILETTREYYDRGGRFTNIPDKYPCVIYFGVVDFEAVMPNIEKLDWIYVGEH